LQPIPKNNSNIKTKNNTNINPKNNTNINNKTEAVYTEGLTHPQRRRAHGSVDHDFLLNVSTEVGPIPSLLFL